MFIGREDELNLLESRYKSKKSELAVIYGRRRIGKSTLLEQFLKDKEHAYSFEAIEDYLSSNQLKHFTESLKEQFKDPLLEGRDFDNWREVFTFITERLLSNKKKTVLVFDEFQWMSAGRKRLVSLIKFFWDTQWKKKNVMLVLCGSIASFMVNKVINSTALYGRINTEILLEALNPDKSAKFFKKKRSKHEILKYLMIYGGVPKYLEEIDLNKSFEQNINEQCFSKSGEMFMEYKKIFYKQFEDAKMYLRIVNLLKDKAYTLSELASKLKVQVGGSFKQYLTNLEDAEFISSFISADMKQNTKFKKYKLSDEYLCFYFKYIEPNANTIKKKKSKKLFEELCVSKWQSWLGFAFERFCYKNAFYLAEQMGFADQVLDFAPYYGKSDNKFQIDLIYKRSDKIWTVCEIKYHDKPLGTKLIAEMSQKCASLPLPKGYTLETALITVNGIDKHLEDAQYFHHVLEINSFL